MICLSSGESEFNGGVAAASEALFFKKILEFHGHPVAVNIWLDSSAARGAFQRQGVGRIRHLEAKSLWVQEALRRKEFALHAVGTHENTADIGTKALAQAKLVQHRETLRVWGYERFIQGCGGVIGGVSMIPEMSEGSLEAIMRGLKLLAAIGMMQVLVKAEDEQERAQLGWFQLVMIISLVWTAASMLAVILWIVTRLRRTWRIQAGETHRGEILRTRESREVAVVTSPV